MGSAIGFTWIDWTIMGGFIVGMLTIAFICNRYMKSVADFISANRCAGRYLLAVSDGMAGSGAISIVAGFERAYEAGFTMGLWGQIIAPLYLLLAFSGWVLYRFRETRCLSMGQFFEIRYSKRFRLFAGTLSWVAGVVNMGIFPAVVARLFMRLCNIPETYTVFHVTLGTFPTMMIILLGLAVYCVFNGGQITIIVTDFIQGVFVYIVAIIILSVLVWKFNWTMMIEGLQTAPAGESRINPFKSGDLPNFNLWYVVLMYFNAIYAMGAFQGQQSARTISAKSAHESKMVQLISMWRGMIQGALLGIIPIGAYAIMHHPDFTAVQDNVNQTLAIYSDNAYVQTQMTVPTVLSVILPTGLLGLFGSVLLAAFLTTHDTYLHSWGSLFVQDVILPFRKKPFTPKQHIKLLRYSVLMVAVIVFFFSWNYKQNEEIMMYMQITGAIITAGAGSAIVGGLYWKRGAVSGAWVAIFIGLTGSAGTMFLRQYWIDDIYPWLAANAPNLLEAFKNSVEGISAKVKWINWEVTPGGKFPINSYWMSFFISMTALIAYVSCSLVEWLFLKRPAFDIERMLHRGEYAVEADIVRGVTSPVSGWRALLPTKEFSPFDKFLYFAKFGWTLIWFTIAIVILIYYATGREFADSSWALYHKVEIILTMIIGLLTAIWFSIGGVIDLRNMFHALSSKQRNARDMGMVVGHRSYEEISDEELDSDQKD